MKTKSTPYRRPRYTTFPQE